MMLFYKGQKFTNKAYGEDAPAKWHGGEKGELMAKNSMMNLPYIIDGETIVTQSNSCLLYLGKKLGIDKEEFSSTTTRSSIKRWTCGTTR